MRENCVKTTFSSPNFFLMILLDTVTCLLLIFWPKKAETKSIVHEQIYNIAHPKKLCSHVCCMQVFHICFHRYQGGGKSIFLKLHVKILSIMKCDAMIKIFKRKSLDNIEILHIHFNSLIPEKY